MLTRAEGEPVYAHDHSVFKTEVAGPRVLKSLDRSISAGKDGSEILVRHPYPTWIIQTESADFILEHFSAFEPGYEKSPNQLVRKARDNDGNYISEEVLFQFDKVNSTKSEYHEYQLISGLDLTGIVHSADIKKSKPGLVGRIWAKNDKQIWRYLAWVLIGHEEYVTSNRSVNADPNVESFLKKQILPEPPTGILEVTTEIPVFVSQVA